MRDWRLLAAGVGLLAAGLVLGLLAGALEPRYVTNGERIYFTGRNDRGERIAFSGVPFMGPGATALSCASCHGSGAQGGRHRMHMLVMDAPSIRWSTLAAREHANDHGRYDLATFRLAVVEGRHPDGRPLSDLMPRWQLNERDLADLAAYLQSLDD